jgi:hypothetical protein
MGLAIFKIFDSNADIHTLRRKVYDLKPKQEDIIVNFNNKFAYFGSFAGIKDDELAGIYMSGLPNNWIKKMKELNSNNKGKLLENFSTINKLMIGTLVNPKFDTFGNKERKEEQDKEKKTCAKKGCNNKVENAKYKICVIGNIDLLLLSFFMVNESSTKLVLVEQYQLEFLFDKVH